VALDSRLDHINELYREHELAPFPEGYAEVEVAGVHLVLLDSDITGCIWTYLGSRGRLDWHHIDILRRCHQDACLVVPELTGDAQVYFARLERIAAEVLKALHQSTRTADNG
jgi:hypothetical protein